MKRNILLCGVGLAWALGAAVSAAAADTKSDNRIVCVPIQDIQNTPATDDKTILLELSGHRYKRIDLMNNCTDVTIRGFAYDTSTQDLCTTNTLHVNETAGASCMIKDIVDITPEQAKELRMKK